MADKVRLGIIGLGAQGSMYAKFIADGLVPNMEIGALSDHNPEKAETVGSLVSGGAVLSPTTSPCWTAATWTP